MQQETEQEKAERKTRVDDAVCSLLANAVSTARELHSSWSTMTWNEKQEAIDAQTLSQLRYFADEYRVEPDELRQAVFLT